MLLIGRNTSPFVRRVAVSLRLLDIPFEQNPLSTITDRDAVRAYNPMGRIPALVLDDHEVLIDSTPILDYLDELAGPERALAPPSGRARREVLRLVAFGVGVMEKTLWSYVERNHRPESTRHQALLDHYGDQVLAGLTVLEQALGDGWLFGATLTQADVTAVAAYDFLRLVWPEMAPAGRYPKLEGLRARADALPAFADTRT